LLAWTWLSAPKAKPGAAELLKIDGLSFSISCEIDTMLRISGGNPPTFIISGNGVLTSIRYDGIRQREAQGEDAHPGARIACRMEFDYGSSLGCFNQLNP
jgi:hypothetical protein